jgi:hypothetical protein
MIPPLTDLPQWLAAASPVLHDGVLAFVTPRAGVQTVRSANFTSVREAEGL